MTIKEKDRNNLVWIDLEMSGLDPNKDRIIEIATIVTDQNLNIIEEGPNIVIHQSQRILNGMDEWNTKEHTQSGLVEKVLLSQTSTEQAEEQTLKFLKKYCYAKKSPLCGNSVHHDRRFLVRYMPELANFLHYRIIDVSSFGEVVRRWYPASLIDKKPKKQKLHQALADIRESIEELKFYRENIFDTSKMRKGARKN